VWWNRYQAAAADWAEWSKRGASDGRTHRNAFYDGPE
jgi:hypothetical protein